MPDFTVGPVGHFSLAVRDPRASAAWFTRVLGLEPYMEPEDGLASVGNDAVTVHDRDGYRWELSAPG